MLLRCRKSMLANCSRFAELSRIICLVKVGFDHSIKSAQELGMIAVLLQKYGDQRVDGAGEGIARNHAVHERRMDGVRGFEDMQKGRTKKVVFVTEATIDAAGRKLRLRSDIRDGRAFEPLAVEDAAGGLQKLVESALTALLLRPRPG
jgi:hypothetical protein